MIKILFSILLLWAAVLFAATPRVLSHDQLTQRLKLRLQEDLGSGVQIAIENYSAHDPVPDGAALASVQPIPPLGLISFEWIYSSGQQLRKIPATAVVRAFAEVATAKTQIKFQEPLTAQNIEFKRMEITHHRNTGYYLDWDRVLGLKAKVFMTQGTVIGTNNAAPPALISAGEMVDLIYQKGNLKITGRVKALDGGTLAQWIRVQNPRSLKIFQAKVSGEGEVSTR